MFCLRCSIGITATKETRRKNAPVFAFILRTVRKGKENERIEERKICDARAVITKLFHFHLFRAENNWMFESLKMLRFAFIRPNGCEQCRVLKMVIETDAHIAQYGFLCKSESDTGSWLDIAILTIPSAQRFDFAGNLNSIMPPYHDHNASQSLRNEISNELIYVRRCVACV